MSDSVECQTFRTCFKNVVGGISDPNSLAVSLYSKGIISDVTRAEVASTGVILTDRILKLLVAVEYQIRRDSKVFHSFLGALREDKSLVYLADFLTAAYRICSTRRRERLWFHHPQCFDLPERNWKVTELFSVALMAIKGFLEDLVEPCKLKKYLCCLCHPLQPEKPYIRSRHYESATTTSEIIQSLFPEFINYRNTGLLWQIVRFGCDRCKAALHEYLQHYSKFIGERLCNMPNAVSDEELDRATGVKRLRVEIDMSLEDATIADAKTVQNRLEQATGIDSCFITLAQYDPGPLILTFLVPESISEIFHELCEEDLEVLANCGVTRLQIEDCVVENIHEYRTNADRIIEQTLYIDHPGKGISLALLLKKVACCTQYAHLVNLLAGIPHENMQRECSNNVLRQLAPTIGNWTELAPYLGITESEVQQITMQYHSMEEQSYQALLQWKQLYQDSATHEGLVELLVCHAPLSTVEAALNIISPAMLVQMARHVLQQAYLTCRSGRLWPGAPRMMEFSQRLRRGLNTAAVSVKSLLNAVSQKKKRLFLLKGPHGSGKTILLRRACSLWARGLCWRKFTLVLWVDMKVLANALAHDPQYSFMNFMQHAVPKGVDLKDVCDWVHTHEGEDILLVLDGIDSLADNECKPFLDAILSEPHLKKGSIITTSSFLHHLFSMRCSQYSLLGLSEDQITRQVISYYSDSPLKVEDFFTYISATPAVKELCSNPPCLAAVLSVFDSGYSNDLPATWTQFFKQLILLFIRQCPTLNQSAIDQPIIQQLAQWTYHGGVIPERLNPFFNMVTPPYTSVKPAVIYGHFALPWLASRYLAALHIHTLPLELQAALMRSQRVGDDVWQFFAGTANTLNHVLSNFCGRDTMKYASCAHEARNIGSQEVEMHQLTVKETPMTAYETHVMLSVAQNSSKPCRVTLKTRLLEAGALTEIGKSLTAVRILGTGGIGELSITGGTGDRVSLQEARVLARGVAVSCTLKTLSLRRNTIPDAGIRALAIALTVNQSLEELDLESTNLSAVGACILASALCVNHSLKVLNLSSNKIPDAGVSALAGVLRVNQSLEELHLEFTHLSAERASVLASALCVNCSLKVLNASRNTLRDAGVSALAGVLRVNQSLEELHLRETGLSAEGASALASALHVNHSLKVLNLSRYRIPDAGISALAGALSVNWSLEELDLESIDLSAEGASALASALQVNHSLKVLDLSWNMIPDAGISALAVALKINRGLEKLQLWKVDLSAKGAYALASALCVNRSLKKLIIDLDSATDRGVSELANALEKNSSLRKLILYGVRRRMKKRLRDIGKRKRINIEFRSQ